MRSKKYFANKVRASTPLIKKTLDLIAPVNQEEVREFNTSYGDLLKSLFNKKEVRFV